MPAISLRSLWQWGTAAIVWAFTEDQQGSNQHRAKVRDALGIREFAALDIRGLKSDNSVRKYRNAWQHAIDEGWGGLLSAGQWGTAAIVWAFVEPHQGKRTSIKSDGSLTIDAFSKIGIRGLSSINSVRKYRQAWQHAIDEGWAELAEPGERCVLPEQPFELPKIEHSAAEPATFDEDAAGGRLRDWLRAELSKWPDKYKPEAAHWG